MTYSKQKQRQYDNQSPDESGDERDEWIAERAEGISYEWMSNLTRVAAALDDMGAESDVGPTGSTALSEMVARILTAEPGNDEDKAIIDLHGEVRTYFLRDAETMAATEYDTNYLPTNFKGEE